jgi:hypothetical protein
MKPDIVIEMAFDMKQETVQIRTNAKRGVISELLADYVHAQVGAGKDESPPEVHDIYNITIGVELDDDSWGSTHNCGNKGLREGIIMQVINLLDKHPDRVTYLD